MKIIYRGGYNKRDEVSIRGSMFYEYAEMTGKLITEGRKVVFVNFAKPDGYYDERIKKLYGHQVEIIDTKNQDKVDWSSYDLIYLPGGNTQILQSKMFETGFEIKSLKKTVIVIGESSGAFVMSAYYASKGGIGSENVKRCIVKGLNSDSGLVTIAHADNPTYVSEHDLNLVDSFANENGLTPLKLKENEAVLIDQDGELKRNFNFAELF